MALVLPQRVGGTVSAEPRGRSGVWSCTGMGAPGQSRCPWVTGMRVVAPPEPSRDQLKKKKKDQLQSQARQVDRHGEPSAQKTESVPYVSSPALGSRPTISEACGKERAGCPQTQHSAGGRTLAQPS